MEDEARRENNKPDESLVKNRHWPYICAVLVGIIVLQRSDNKELQTEALKRADREIAKSDKNAENALLVAQLSKELNDATSRFKIYTDSLSDVFANRAKQSAKTR